MLDALIVGLVSFDLAVPASLAGVVDELRFGGQSLLEAGGVGGGVEELRAGEDEVAFAGSFLGQAEAVAEFEFGLEEVGLQPGHGVGVEAVVAQGGGGRSGQRPCGGLVAADRGLVLGY